MSEKFYSNRDFGDETTDKNDRFNPDMEGRPFHQVPEDYEVPYKIEPPYEYLGDGINIESPTEEPTREDDLARHAYNLGRFMRLSDVLTSALTGSDMQPGKDYVLEYQSYSNPLRTGEFPVTTQSPFAIAKMAEREYNQLKQMGQDGTDIARMIVDTYRQEREGSL